VTVFITKDLKAQQFLYRRMHEVPFIIFTENNLQIDRAMTQFPWGREWAGTILIEWNEVSSIHIEEQKVKISLKDTQRKSQKLNLTDIKN
jgi:tRNA A37 threonylcarbamoyladenosine biosynthesis protein TsaE